MANTIFISTIEVQHLNDEFHVTINTRNLVQNDFWRAGNPAFFSMISQPQAAGGQVAWLWRDWWRSWKCMDHEM